jgi:hypothetical protein
MEHLWWQSAAATPLSRAQSVVKQMKNVARSKTAGARLCEPQQYGQPEGRWNELTRLEYSPLLRVTDPRSETERSHESGVFRLRLAMESVEFTGSGIAFHLPIPIIILEWMQQCLQLATFLRRELLNG